jgi:uncharacterized membrane protein YccC
MLTFLAIHLSQLGRAFWSEIRLLSVPGPRMIDEAECVASVLLAIVLSHAIGAENVGWAAFSGYMVMRSHVKDSLTRGALRVAGTIIGAGVALALAPLLLRNAWPLSAGLLIAGSVTLYFAIVGRRAYAWLLTGLTFLMVLIEGMEHAEEPILRFAETRVLEVLAGTIASTIVSAISTWTIRRTLPNPDQAMRAKPANWSADWWHPAVARHALVVGVALALIPWVWLWLRIPALSQSSVTIYMVMMMPAAAISNDVLSPLSRRMVNRLVGCLAGAALASAVLLLSHHSPLGITIGLCLGVIIGRHIENGATSMSYAGLQFTLTFLVVLVPDNYGSAAPEPGFDRLIGILFGLMLLEPAVLVGHLVGRRRALPDALSAAARPRTD